MKLQELLGNGINTIVVDDQIVGASYYDYKNLIPFQGELKTLSDKSCDKMMCSLLEKGFFDIKKIWRKGGEVFIIDGHQTIATLTKFAPMFANGTIKMVNKSNGKPTTLIPCVSINAKDEKEAAELILLINSNYGVITADGLDSFLKVFGIEPQFSQIAEIPQWDVSFPSNTDWSSPFNGPSSGGNYNPSEDYEKPTIVIKENDEESKEDFIPYTIMFPMDEFKAFVELVKVVKKERGFEMNHAAVTYIAQKYEASVLSEN